MLADGKTVRVRGCDAKRAGSYTCPECAEPVVPKLGKTVVWHFAHRAKGDCEMGGSRSGTWLSRTWWPAAGGPTWR
jgi:competence CoiA-like predicted nuclease